MSDAGIRFSYAPLKYFIAWEWAATKRLAVTGYAVLLPPPFERLRVCVRESYGELWVADHFDSGMSMMALPALTRPGVQADRFHIVQALPDALREVHVSGFLREAFNRVGFGWCLDEAGL